MGLELRILTDESNNTGFTLDIEQNEDFPLALNFGIAEIQDIAKTKSTFSKTFKVPETVENNKNLNSIYYSSTSDDSGVKSTNVAIIIEDGTPISKGYVRIKNVTETERGREYEFVFFGSNFAWIKKFRELSLQDLDFTSDNHTYNATTIEASWDDGAGNPADADDRSYIYPIVSYGLMANGYPESKDLRPAVFCKSVLDKAWEVLLDSTVEQYNITSTFLDSTYFKRLAMPFVNGQFVSDANKDTEEDVEVNRLALYTLNYNNDGEAEKWQSERILINNSVSGNTSQNVDKDAYYNLTTDITNGYYIDNGIYDIEFRTTAEVIAGTVTEIEGEFGFFSFPREVTRTSNLVEISFVLGQKSTSSIINLGQSEFKWRPTKDNNTKEIVITTTLSKDALDADDYNNIWVSAVARMESGEKYNFDLNLTNTVFKATKKEDVVLGQTVNLAKTLPDVKVVDYFKGLAHMFNLYVDTDEWTREIKIEPRDDFYKANSQAIDWTDKLDLSSGFNINYIDSYNQSIRFEYKEDSADKLAERYTNDRDTKLGAGEVDLSGRFPKGETVFLNPFFSGTIHNRVELNGGLSPIKNDKKHVIPCMWNKIGTLGNPSTPTYRFNPRIMFYDYSNQTDNDSNTLNWKFEGTTKDKIPTLYFTDTVTGSTLDQEHMHFEGTNGLIDKYYQGTLGLMNEGVTISTRFYLTKEDIQRLDLSTPIYISAPSQIAGYYVINTITDYKPSIQGSTRVLLTKVVDTAPVVSKDKFKTDIEIFGSDSEPFKDNWRAKDRNPWEVAEESSGGSRYDNQLDPEREDYFTDQNGIQWNKEDNGKSKDRDSFVLNNGSGTFAKAGSGSISMGNGTVALGNNQTALGNFNSPSTSDILSVGAGTDDDNRVTALSVTNKGTVQIYGGEVYMEDSNGNIVSVMTEVDNKYEKVYLSK
jgi:hypothetical protein